MPLCQIIIEFNGDFIEGIKVDLPFLPHIGYRLWLLEPSGVGNTQGKITECEMIVTHESVDYLIYVDVNQDSV